MKRIINLVLSYLPSRLPSSMDEFDIWYKSILQLGGYPDNLTFKRMLGMMLQSVSKKYRFLSKQAFVREIQRAITTEMAFHVIESASAEIKAAKNAEQSKVSGTAGEVV